MMGLVLAPFKWQFKSIGIYKRSFQSKHETFMHLCSEYSQTPLQNYRLMDLITFSAYKRPFELE
jgi:hypothetical protein